MPGKKKQAKKKGAKSNAAKSGKGSPGKANVAKAAPAGAKASNGDTTPKAKPVGKAEPNKKEAAKKKPKTDLAPLRKKAQEAKAVFEKVGKEADILRAKAKEIESKAKAAYAEAVTPYRDACRKAGVECEFAGGRATNVTATVGFLIEKVKGGIKVTIKGKPETGEVLTDKALGESVNRAAFGYTDKHIGPKEKIGNKGGGLAVRLRAILAKQ
jgi:hypothetical protein